MSLGGFLQARAWQILVAFITIGALCGIAAVCALPVDAVVLMALVGCAGLALVLIVLYARVRRFYGDMRDLSSQLEHAYQLPHFLDEGTAPEQRLMFQALETMGHACAAEVSQAEAQMDAYRMYVEAWVHEVKTPLAALLLVAERLPEPERSQVRRELDAMGRQVDQALWYARLIKPESDFAVKEMNLREAVQEACRRNARYLIEQGVTPVIDVDANAAVFADSKQVAFMVSQMVVNAAKYGATQIRFSTQIREGENRTQVLNLCIADNGKGIPAQDVPRVFERGFTGERGRECGASTGMGLFLVAQLCQQAGLGLSVSSEEGEGTTFTIAFPFDRRHLDLT